MKTVSSNTYYVTNALTLLMLALIPLYVLPSGGFQLVDVPIVLLSAAVMFTASRRDVEEASTYVAPFIPFAFWVILVNSGYSLTSDTRLQYVVSTVEVVYNFAIFFILTIVFNRSLRDEKGIRLIYMGLLLSCAAALVYPSRSDYNRLALSFQNPNQLAYFCILAFMIVLISANLTATSKYKSIIDVVAIMLVALFSNIYVLSSQSRAGLVGVAILDFYMVLILFKYYRKMIVIVPYILMVAIVVMALEGKFLKTQATVQYSGLIDRLQQKHLVSVTDLQERTLGYLKVRDNSTIVVGEGARRQLDQKPQGLQTVNKEIHNSLLATFQYYGVIGFLLFVIGAAIFLVRTDLPYKWILLAPAVGYNMSHYGLRFRMMWIAMALLAAASIMRKRKSMRASAALTRPAVVHDGLHASATR
jgi:hypothetical protein